MSLLPRLRRLACLAAAALAVAGCERMAVGSQTAARLRDGRSFVARLERDARDSGVAIGAQTAIALGYVERQRLGLGSPFRLIDYVLIDARLSTGMRDSVAWALLARTLDGDGDQVDAAALDSLEDTTTFAAPIGGAAQLALIDRVVSSAHDARAGELAVRLGYALAVAEHRLRPNAVRIAAQAAALARDRRLARDDAGDLLRIAWHRDVDPLPLIAQWRRERRFRVERPLMERLSPDAELEAMNTAPDVEAVLRGLEANGTAIEPPAPTLLGDIGERLAGLARAAAMPPETPIVVSLWRARASLLDAPNLTPELRAARSRFAWHARAEESLAAEHAVVVQRAPGIAVARATLDAATALRAYAQEVPWVPGTPAPSAAELAGRFGVQIAFDSTVPTAWRPYYRAMLASALDDLDRVLPALDLDGLRVHVGENPLRGVALAMHDPARRIIYFPTATSAGTIAHEIAHDIDWQAARTRYAVRGDYATDRAMRDGRSGQLAASMMGLTAASMLTGARDEDPPLSRRPTEVFARSVDWFVAVSLAREGRMNGYLSSVEDDLLTGYVTVTPPDVTGEAGSALVRILDDVAPPAPLMRDWFLTRYGPGRALTPYDLVRRTLETPLDDARAADSTASLTALVEPVRRERDAVLASIDGGQCAERDARDSRLAAARHRLVTLAARARAAGILRERAARLAADAGARWALAYPYDATRSVVEAASAGVPETVLASRAASVDSLLGPEPPLRSVCAATRPDARR